MTNDSSSKLCNQVENFTLKGFYTEEVHRGGGEPLQGTGAC